MHYLITYKNPYTNTIHEQEADSTTIKNLLLRGFTIITANLMKHTKKTHLEFFTPCVECCEPVKQGDNGESYYRENEEESVCEDCYTSWLSEKLPV